jgi:hypothetical protein
MNLVNFLQYFSLKIRGTYDIVDEIKKEQEQYILPTNYEVREINEPIITNNANITIVMQELQYLKYIKNEPVNAVCLEREGFFIKSFQPLELYKSEKNQSHKDA